MKALANMTGGEKGKLLANLFPDQKENMVKAIEQLCTYIKQNKEQMRGIWESDSETTMTFEQWFSISVEVADTIEKLRYILYQSSAVFGDQLFCDELEIFTGPCLLGYARESHANTIFSAAVVMLFHEDHEFEILF